MAERGGFFGRGRESSLQYFNYFDGIMGPRVRNLFLYCFYRTNRKTEIGGPLKGLGRPPSKLEVIGQEERSYCLWRDWRNFHISPQPASASNQKQDGADLKKT